jgi:beta-glucosidase-like glycosyl hydrolase
MGAAETSHQSLVLDSRVFVFKMVRLALEVRTLSVVLLLVYTPEQGMLRTVLTLPALDLTCNSWNKSLAYARAHAMGGEFYRKGVSIALGPPVVGPLGRIAEGGRNWEGFSNDPYLSGMLAAESGVIACTKHFIVNEQETNRNPLRDVPNNVTIQSSSSNIDDKTVCLLRVSVRVQG